MIKIISKILYILSMNENVEKEYMKTEQKGIFPSDNTMESKVADFLKSIDFGRTFPLDLILLADKIDKYKIFYFLDSATIQEKAEAAINTDEKTILLNTRFRTSKESFFVGRYIICKIIAHCALNHIPKGSGWLEPKVKFREDGDKVLNRETADFAYELLLPKKDFLEQWEKLGEDVSKMSLYFAASERHIVERKNFLLGNNCGRN